MICNRAKVLFAGNMQGREKRKGDKKVSFFQLRSLPKIPFSLGLRILFKNQLKPRTQGVKSHSNHKHVWSIDQSSFGRFLLGYSCRQ
jgi:hypothetical protein